MFFLMSPPLCVCEYMAVKGSLVLLQSHYSSMITTNCTARLCLALVCALTWIVYTSIWIVDHQCVLHVSQFPQMGRLFGWQCDVYWVHHLSASQSISLCYTVSLLPLQYIIFLSNSYIYLSIRSMVENIIFLYMV